MSADNWADCPRCTQRGQAKLDERQAAINAVYGKMSVELFDEIRRDHAGDVKAFEQRERTFREDYEIDGAEDGIVKVSYHGQCTKCGLALTFTDEHPIPGAYPGPT